MGKLLGVTAEEIEQDRRNQEGLPPITINQKENKKDTAKPVAAELYDTGSDIKKIFKASSNSSNFGELLSGIFGC